MKIDYSRYFWQNDLVRLRPWKKKDGIKHYEDEFDSVARRKLQYVLELPPVYDAVNSDEEEQVYNPDNGRYSFSIETLEGQYVGSFNLNGIDERNGTFGIGMQITREERGKGYGTSAMKILLDYAFNERRLNKFNVTVIDSNVASATMLKKLGCVQEGIRRQVIYMEGKFHDEVFYGLLKDEFNSYHKR